VRTGPRSSSQSLQRAGAVNSGSLPSAFGFVLWGYAVARLPVVASTSLLHPVAAVAVLISFHRLGEIRLLGELLGGAAIVLGVMAISQDDRLLGRLRPTRTAPHDLPEPAVPHRPASPSASPSSAQEDPLRQGAE
jgi:drug/metabolite transporter (DMT)-like permease